MNIEYEIRVLEIDKDDMISKLEQLGAKKEGEWFQKRFTYDTKQNLKVIINGLD